MLGYKFRQDYYEVDKTKKNIEWATRVVSDLRLAMSPIIDPLEAQLNRLYMMGEQPTAKYKKKFRLDAEKLPFEFEPLAIMEEHRNILTAEREKAGVAIGLNSLDATAMEETEKDKKLMKRRKSIEGVMNYFDQSMGGPKYNLLKEKDENGKKIFNGNVDQFDELGLDAGDPDDVAHFYETWYRLDHEVAAELAVTHFVETNELAEFLKLWFDEILANKVCAGRVFVDELTLSPVYKYHKPETIKAVKGKRRDFKDAKAILVEENMTVHEFIHMVGDELTPEKLEQVLMSANYYTKSEYDGIIFKDGSKSSAGCKSPVPYDDFVKMKFAVGYIEWKSQNNDTAKVGKNAFGNHKRFEVNPNYKIDPKSSYTLDEKNYEVTYKAYFLATTNNTQELFKFGQLFDHDTYGPEDEYSAFSFIIYQEPGPSVAKIARPHIDTIHDAWFKFNWILNKAKPKGTRYNYNVVAAIASKMYKGEDEKSSVMKVIQMFQNSIDDFYINDSLNPKVGGGQNPHFDKPGGLDAAVTEFYNIITSEDNKIGQRVGSNALQPFIPTSNEGFRIREQAMGQSRNATDYMGRMVMSMLKKFGIRTLSIIQDMIQYVESDACKMLMKAIGNEAVMNLRNLKKIPLHKYGIIIDSFNTETEKMERKKDAYMAHEKGQIPYHVYLLITSIDSPKKAAKILAYHINKEQKTKQKEAQQLHANAIELQDKIHANAMELTDNKNSGLVAGYAEQNKGLIEANRQDNETKVLIKQMGIDAEPGKNFDRANQKIREQKEKANIDKGEPVATDEIV